MKKTESNALEASVEDRLRQFMLYLAGFVWAGSILELILVEHVEGWLQYIPFVVSALGIAAVTAVVFRPSHLTRKSLRIICLFAILASVVGSYKHYVANLEFAKEVNVGAPTTELLWEALFGVGPLMAPGVLALAAILALVSMWNMQGE